MGCEKWESRNKGFHAHTPFLISQIEFWYKKLNCAPRNGNWDPNEDSRDWSAHLCLLALLVLAHQDVKLSTGHCSFCSFCRGYLNHIPGWEHVSEFNNIWLKKYCLPPSGWGPFPLFLVHPFKLPLPQSVWGPFNIFNVTVSCLFQVCLLLLRGNGWTLPGNISPSAQVPGLWVIWGKCCLATWE